MADVTFGDTVVDWLIISAGVLIAVVLPLLTAAVKANFGVATAAIEDYKRYAALAAFCTLTAALILAVYRAAEPDTEIAWFTALLAGYGWEATIEKLGAKA